MNKRSSVFCYLSRLKQIIGLEGRRGGGGGAVEWGWGGAVGGGGGKFPGTGDNGDEDAWTKAVSLFVRCT